MPSSLDQRHDDLADLTAQQLGLDVLERREVDPLHHAAVDAGLEAVRAIVQSRLTPRLVGAVAATIAVAGGRSRRFALRAFSVFPFESVSERHGVPSSVSQLVVVAVTASTDACCGVNVSQMQSARSLKL